MNSKEGSWIESNENRREKKELSKNFKKEKKEKTIVKEE